MEQKSTLKLAMNYGAMLGMALIMLSLLFYLLGLDRETWVGIVSYAVMIGGLYLSLKHARDQELDGYISYSKGLGLGTLISLFAGILAAFYTYIFISFIDSGIVDFAMQEAYDNMLNQGMTEEEADQNMQIATQFMTPGMISVMGFFGYVFMGFIFSLVTSAIVKKENPDTF